MNQLKHAVNPINLRECLADASPVASTPMPKAMRYCGLIHTADTPETCITAVEACLSGDAYGRKQR
jgi:hypothetical protein